MKDLSVVDIVFGVLMGIILFWDRWMLAKQMERSHKLYLAREDELVKKVNRYVIEINEHRQNRAFENEQDGPTQ